jgi:MOSC domain-containing protein YiiM/ferredoxin-NADP reductase/ferredoxin
MAKLISVNAGLPRNIEWSGRTVYTGIWKTAVDGARTVRKLNVDGDGQGDLGGHGGENRAVYVYQLASYRHWETELHRSDFTMGQFGENFTVDGLPDDEVCIGDRYKIGGALFEVSQPRVTCYRVGIRMNEPRMASLLVSHERPGFYFRVLEEGEVRAGDAIELVAQGAERMTVAEVSAQLYLPRHSREQMERALRIPALSSGWRASFQALLEQGDGKSGNPGLAPSDLAPAAWSGFRDARIATLKRETADVVSLEIESADGTDLTAPLPGQFVVLKISLPSQTSPVMRSFSICDVPRTSAYCLGIKAEPHGVVGPYLRDVAKVGDAVQVSAPRGAFVLRPGDEPVVLLSAGIGVTPVLGMLHALARESSQREIWWLYAARNRAEHPFADEIRTLLAELRGSRSYVWYSRPGDDDVVGRDFDCSGHVELAQLSTIGVKPDGHFYLCGPASFLRDMRAGLVAWGVAPDRIYSETFGSGPSQTPGVVSGEPKALPHAPVGPPGTGPSISFARSGIVAPWSTTCNSLLEFAEACDVPVRWSCRTGVCHSCESGLISGDVTYNPEPLDPPASGDLLLCCSTPRGDVVLDL